MIVIIVQNVRFCIWTVLTYFYIICSTFIPFYDNGNKRKSPAYLIENKFNCHILEVYFLFFYSKYLCELLYPFYLISKIH